MISEVKIFLVGEILYIFLLHRCIFLVKFIQGGHIPAKIKFPVFSLSFPCAR